MKRENLHQPFEICFSELDESQLKEHDHTFFELVYILSGTGIQWINNNKFPYHDGHLFMITPGDIHSFDIHTTTKFVYIKFNDIYIHSAVLERRTFNGWNLYCNTPITAPAVYYAIKPINCW